MIKAILFDMDGTIVDSNHIHYNNWNEVFGRYGIKLDRQEFGFHLGESAHHFVEFFVNKYLPGKDIDMILKEIFHNFEARYSSKVLLKKDAKKVLESLDFKKALATGANHRWAKYIVEKYALPFDFIIGGDEVKRAKPDPEIFLKAAMNFNLKPDECIVVEDALLGMQAAKAAGMKVIAIPDEFTKSQDHTISDLMIKDLLGLKRAIKEIDAGFSRKC